MRTTILAAGAWLLLAGAAGAEDVRYELRVDGMTCPFCVASAERSLRRIEGVSTVSTDLEAGIIRVCADERVAFSDEQLRRLFLDKGFTYRSMTRRETCAAQDAARGERR